MKELKDAIEREWQEVDNAIKQHDKEKALYHNQIALWLEELADFRRGIKKITNPNPMSNMMVEHFLSSKDATITFTADNV